MPRASCRLAILVAVLLTSSGWSASRATSMQSAQPATRAQLKDLSEALEKIRQAHGGPAVAAAIMRDGVLLGTGVSGVRSIESGQPASVDDLWPIGSCTKPMTRLMILRLFDQGLLRLDAPLGELLADLDMQEGYRSATLAQVLSHTAGIQPYTRIGPSITPILWELKGTPREQRAQFLRHVLAEPPVARPGERFNYSNAGFSVAAAVAEQVTDKSWEQLIQQQVFEPLGLKSATTDDQAQITPAGHRRTNEGFVAPARQMPRLAPMAPAGGVRLNIFDFVTFASVQADLEAGRPGAELTAGAVRAAAELRPADAPPGPGIYFGGDGLHTAAFAIWPEKRVAIAVASNAGESDDLCARVIEALRAAFAPDVPAFAVEAE